MARTENHIKTTNFGTLCRKIALIAISIQISLAPTVASPTISCAAGFKDIDYTSPYYSYVYKVAEAGFINTYKDGSFHPNGLVTKAEFATFLAEIPGIKSEIPASETYRDVRRGSVFYEAIESVRDIVHGEHMYDGNLYFRPGNPTLRIDAIEAFARMNGYAMGSANLRLLNGLSEADSLNTRDRTYTALAIQHGILQGDWNGALRLGDPITRQELCVMLYNAVSANPKFSNIKFPNPPPPPAMELDPNKPAVALTFDDGPGGCTMQIVSALQKYNARATFCVVGNYIKSYPDYPQAIRSVGSEVISHTKSHATLTNLSVDEIRDELTGANDLIEAAIGERPKLFRAPHGRLNEDVRNVAAELGLGIIGWSVDTADWDTRNEDAIYASIMDNVRDGCIVLCHDPVNQTAKAMERVIPALIERGYQLVTVSELLGFAHAPAEPGVVYYGK